MQYAAALIEYVVTGLISLVWIILLVSIYVDINDYDYNKYKEIIIICIFPTAYIAGIFIDVISSYTLKLLANILKQLNNKIENVSLLCKVKKSFQVIFTKFLDKDSYNKSAEILSFSTPDTIRTMEAYVSRDRIARGMFLNSLIISFVLIINPEGHIKTKLIIASFTVAFISLFIRIRLLSLSNTFKNKALVALNKRAESIKNGD